MPLGQIDEQGPLVIKPLPRSQVPPWFGSPALAANLTNEAVSILGHVRLHRRIAAAFAAVLWTIAEHGDEQLIDTADYGGTYSDRTVRGSTARSPHAWAIAMDLNVHHFRGSDREDIKRDRTNFRCQRQQIARSLEQLAPYFNAWGICWGGHWNKRYIDPMHFEATELTVKLLEGDLSGEEEDVINGARAVIHVPPVGKLEEGVLKIVPLPGSDQIECHARLEDGVTRVDLRPVAERLGWNVIPDHIKDQQKVYLRRKS